MAGAAYKLCAGVRRAREGEADQARTDTEENSTITRAYITGK